MIDQEHLKTLNCGLFKAHISDVYCWDKITCDIIKKEKFQYDISEYTIDIKVHMLMPGQFPCIPGNHFDLVPRVDGKQDFSQVDTTQKLYLWVSNPPITSFTDGREVLPQKFIEFTQLDEHTGTVSTEHTWRMFIRLAPTKIYPLATVSQRHRRHCQVYLNAKDFKW